MSYPDIYFENPLKECVMIAGMRQEGKSNLFAYLLAHNPNPYVAIDTMGVLTKAKFQPLESDTQQILYPTAPWLDSFLVACKEVWNRGNVIFAIEEIGQYCTKHSIPVELRKLINLGGNRNIALWFTTRRIAEVHNDVVANCIHHFIFRTYLPTDVDYYRGYIGNVIDMAKDLPRFHFIYYRIGSTPKIFKPVEKVI